MTVNKKAIKKKPETKIQEAINEQVEDVNNYMLMIAEAAYYKAEKQGFEPGHELENWIEAEKEIIGELEKS